MQVEIKCKNKYKSKNQPSTFYRICTNTQIRKNRLYVYDPFSHCWTIGFKSYDGLGVVFYCRLTKRYEFSGVVVESSVLRSRSFGKSPYYGSFLSFEIRLQKGIDTEKKIYKNLKSVDSGFYVHHLERSGLKSRGTDVVISKQKEKCEDPFDTVCEGFCAIEVLGTHVRNKNGKPVLTYHHSKDFYVWQQELLKYNVLPVIAFEFDNNYYYVVLTADVLFKCFWIKHNDSYHQQTGNVPIYRLNDYVINVNQLFDCLEWYLKTLKIIKTIEDTRPICFSNTYLYSSSYSCTDPNMYDIALDNVKKYGF